ncbi:hypothetical protein GCM10027034_43330 [Ramlibacter solisilvae]|uniref:Uncharacterized protein n=1 Tax=Ramlibacter tataouinensis TaxID=94132 RepID=A0A127JT52_9BURK|nr:hypothetical protein [Ramlibacter tataouinensis]AMO23198.1 hypothetical protein UC35_10210 [Ramlibacter tataouinensis]
MRKYRLLLAAGALASCCLAASAQTCEGGVYLNPQVIRGEGTPQVARAAQELSEFIGRGGLSASPVVNVSSLEEAVAAVKGPRPPCWVYGNPVVGLASGYKPIAVNTEEIKAAILLLGDLGSEKDPKPVELSQLKPDEQAQVLDRLRQATCFGMQSGVTTALVKAEKRCGKVADVPPKIGLGQSYLPTKAAFEWRPDRWVGVITRVQGARSASMHNQIGADPKIHHARLFVIPTKQTSWGYGIYVRHDTPADVAARTLALFDGLKSKPPSPSLARALDVGAKFEFDPLKGSEVDAMRVALDMAL